MLPLNTKDDLQRLISEGTEEGLMLDYKASPALARDNASVNELCKDVSAFANSAGGQIVYGITENNKTKKPEKIDDGVLDDKITREWIDQILGSRIQPRIGGVRITRIGLDSGKFAYVIEVPMSQTGPHQAPDHKYYKRFELRSVPMFDYEIKDVGRRSSTPNLSVTLKFRNTGSPREALVTGTADGHSHLIRIEFLVSNASQQPAEYAALTTYIDARLAIGDMDKFLSNQPAMGVDGKPCNIFSVNLGLPSSSPLFQEQPEIAGCMAFRLPAMSDLKTFLIGCHIRTPGFTKEQRWDLSQMANKVVIDERFNF